MAVPSVGCLRDAPDRLTFEFFSIELVKVVLEVVGFIRSHVPLESHTVIRQQLRDLLLEPVSCLLVHSNVLL